MDDLQSTKGSDYIWTSNPLDTEETIKEKPPLPVSLAGIVEEKPRYIRDVNLKDGVIIQMVTTPTLERGYIARGVDDYLLCEIDDQENSQGAILNFVGVHKSVEGADAWITEPSQ